LGEASRRSKGRSDIAVAPHQEGKKPGTRSGGSTDHDVEPGEERVADVNTYTTGGVYLAGTPTPRHRQAGHDYTAAPP
jgi:hypothetical protein